MKKVNIIFLMLLVLGLSLMSFTQTVSINFTATKTATINHVNSEYDEPITKLPNSDLNIKFDGQELSMIYKGGKKYWVTKVISYELDKNDYMFKTYLLKIKDGEDIIVVKISKGEKYSIELQNYVKRKLFSSTFFFE